MALYKYGAYLKATQQMKFDARYEPGTTAWHGGIYRCEVCGREIVAGIGEKLPALNHHHHEQRIVWRLAVAIEEANR